MRLACLIARAALDHLPVAAVLCIALWESVRFMVAMLAMFDPSRVPQ